VCVVGGLSRAGTSGWVREEKRNRQLGRKVQYINNIPREGKRERESRERDTVLG
jgi:hypothetical protein